MKKPKFSVPLLIIIGISALILLPILTLFLKSIILDKTNGQNDYSSPYDISDPYITKVPGLKDFLNGPIVDGVDPAFGSNDALITIVEFSDFECEFCQKQEKILKQVLNEYGNKIKLVWKDYPASPESSSYKASIAARCGQAQNNFWPYHDMLFEESHNLNKETFMEIAQELNLNSKQFEKCLEDNETEGLVQDNIKEANALNINGVPFVYINGQEILGEISLEELKTIVEAELNK